MATRVRWVKNNFASTKLLLKKELDNRVAMAADGLREELRAALNENRNGIGTDTGALAESLFVQAQGRNEYKLRLTAAMARYLSEPSLWKDPVRTHVDATAYTVEHFNERVAGEEPLTAEVGHSKAAVATMLAWGYLWEHGHYNPLTEKDEAPRHWMSQPALDWEVAHLANYFKNLLP